MINPQQTLFSVVKTCNAGDMGSIPGSRISPGGGNGNTLHFSCLGNPMNRGSWWLQPMGLNESDTTELACTEI